MKKSKRDNFTKETRLRLAQRVGYKCSFPNCNRVTVGPVLSTPNGINTVGRACHIEAASQNGPRFNSDMSSEDRKNIKNGLWCCNTHADIIDNDTELFSVPALKEWKQLAERYAYEAIDSSGIVEDKPYTLIQIGHNIVFKGIWNKINIEMKEWRFIIDKFLYSDETILNKFITTFDANNNENYVVIDTLGYGRLIKKPPFKEVFGDKTYITFTFEAREEYSVSDNHIDLRFNFEDDRGPDIDFSTDGGLIKGKEAVIQNILILLGTNQGTWWADKNFGTFLYKYYKDFHKDHNLLQRLIKLEIARKSSIPEDGGILSEEAMIPLSSIKWVDDVKIVGHSENYIEIELKLYFSDGEYFCKKLRVPASLQN